MKKLLFALSLFFNIFLVFQMNLAHKRLDAFRQQQVEADRQNDRNQTHAKDGD